MGPLNYRYSAVPDIVSYKMNKNTTKTSKATYAWVKSCTPSRMDKD